MGTENTPTDPPDEEPIDLFEPREYSPEEIEEIKAGKRRHPSNPYPEELEDDIDL